MAVPAKRARLAPRELKLLDLYDDALIMIIDKLDHKSKLQMMLTCKRFEGLIGSTHQFYKNFKFCYNQEESVKTDEDLIKIRRKFGFVEFSGEETYLRSPVLDLLKRIGIQKIKFDSLTFDKAEFLGLMKALPKLKKLEINEIFIGEFDSDEESETLAFELKQLTKLKITNLTNLNSLRSFITFVPTSLKILKFFYIVWKDEQELLGKQKYLRELSLKSCTIKDFEFDPENCHIEKLVIKNFYFPNYKAFEMFSRFMKIQQSVTELDFFISKEEMMWDRDYVGILTHLLNLKTLKKFSIGYDYQKLTIFPHLKVCNPAVETLIIKDPPYEGTDLTLLPKFFPNVTNLKITWPDADVHTLPGRFFVDLQPINSMKKIKKLDIYYMTGEMLTQLELKEMREFHMSELLLVDDVLATDELLWIDCLANWKTFTANHSQLEVLHMPECYMCVEFLQITLENLPLLKSLDIAVYGFILDNSEISADEYKKEQAEKVARLIGEKYDRFEHFKLDFEDDFIRTIVLNYLEEHYPDVKLNK